MSSLVDRVETAISEHDLLAPAEHVVVGLSGGVDSVVLASVLRELGHPIHAVHINYQLRGAASDEDEAFVRAWCEEREVDLHVATFGSSDYAADHGLSIQHAARKIRYETFAREAVRAGISRVAVGHHQDDQAETVLLNLFRGTGLEGLAGMPRKRPLDEAEQIFLIRPLLDLSRGEIEAFARHQGIGWREDASNVKSTYRRGGLRSEVIPAIERHFGGSVSARIAKAADLVRAYLAASLAEDLRSDFEHAAGSDEGHGVLRISALSDMPAVIRRRIIIEAVRRWLPQAEATSTMAEEIDALLPAQPGRRLEWAAGKVWREREHLRFVPPVEQDLGDEVVEVHGPDEAAFAGGILRVEALEHPPNSLEPEAPNIAHVDARVAEFPLTVRRWKEGDRFTPLGMSGSKKLSDFLTDARVPPHRKQESYVVTSRERILWVIGHRIAHAARITSETTKTLRLSYHPAENQGVSKPFDGSTW